MCIQIVTSWLERSLSVFNSLLPPVVVTDWLSGETHFPVLFHYCIGCISSISHWFCLDRIWWTGGSPWLGRSATSERNMMRGFTSQSTGRSDCLETPSWKPALRLPGESRDYSLLLKRKLQDDEKNVSLCMYRYIYLISYIIVNLIINMCLVLQTCNQDRLGFTKHLVHNLLYIPKVSKYEWMCVIHRC